MFAYAEDGWVLRKKPVSAAFRLQDTTLGGVGVRRTIIAALAATAALAGVQSAAAAPVYSVKRSYTMTAGTLTQSATATVQGGTATTATITLDCAADATSTRDRIAAAAIGITECFMLGADGSRHDAADVGAFPGSHAERHGIFHGLKRQPYRVCVKTNVFWRYESTFYVAPRVCSL